MPLVAEVRRAPGVEESVADGLRPLSISEGPTKSLHSQILPGLYGLEPFLRIAAAVEISGEIPPSLVPGSMDWAALDEALDADVTRFPELLEDEVGVFFGHGCREKGSRAGDVYKLHNEVKEVLSNLPEPLDLAGVIEAGEGSAYWLEKILGLMLLRACEVSILCKAPLHLDWGFPCKDPDLEFSYRDAFYWGLSDISAVDLCDGGRSIRVHFVGGFEYLVPVAYVLSWNLEREPDIDPRAVEVAIEEYRKSLSCTLSSGEVLGLTSVSILAGCEPSFEHFGGWTHEARRNVESGFSELGPFRVRPV